MRTVSHIFISYARSNEREAKQVADGLGAQGYGVWRDDELPVHRDYAEVIEERLRAAKAVVVVWSAEAVKSQWVRAEAELAREAGTLVQLSLDGATLPLPFNRIQCADLNAWTGDLGAPGWKKVEASVADLMAAPSSIELQRAGPTRTAKTRDPLLAVMPFDNLSVDPEMAFFSDGVAAEIQQTMSRANGLKVIARASSFQFRGAAKAVRHVAAELKATHVLDGTVRRSGNCVRISAELVAADNETALWSERYDRELSDVFALQEEIATNVATALKGVLAASAPGPIDPDLYDLYLRIQAHPPGVLVDFADPIAKLRFITRRAPKFAPAWALLAWWLAFWRVSPPGAPKEIRAKAQRAARTALRLDPRSSTALIAQCFLEPFTEYARREQLQQKALKAAPGDVLALSSMAGFLDMVGRTREARTYAREAGELDPADARTANQVASLEIRAGRYEIGQRLLEAFDQRWPAHLRPDVTMTRLGWAATMHDWPRFEVLMERAIDLGLESRPGAAPLLAWARAVRDRDAGFAERTVHALEAGLAKAGAPGLDLLVGAMALGLKEQVFSIVARADWARISEDAGSIGGPFSAAIIFDLSANAEMISDSRFVRLCAKLGLCEYWVQRDLWPDCALEVPYDFKSEALRLAGTEPGAFRAT